MRRCLVFPALVVAMLMFAAPARAAVITFDSATVSQGGLFSFDVRVTDMTDLFTFGFDLLFDPTVVSFVGVTEGSFLQSGIVPGGATTFFEGLLDDTVPGALRVVTGSLFGPPEQLGASGDGILATLTFQAVLAGVSGLELANVVLLDSAAPQGNAIAADIVNGAISVEGGTAAVSEPSTLVLLGLGLTALSRRMRRRQQEPVRES